jgi:hypothetical protein
MASCFADDRQVCYHCLERFGVCQKLVPAQTGDEGLDFGNRGQNILDPLLPASKRHE